MIDILLVTFYKDICLDKTLESIRDTVKHPYRLWVLDNKSPRSGEIEKVLFKYRDIISGAWACEYNYVTGPYWWAYLNCVGKDTKYFVMMEGDVVLPPDRGCWLTRASEILDENPKVGVVGLRTKPDDTKENIEWYNSWTPYKNYKDVLETKVMLWHHMVIRKSIIDDWIKWDNYNYFWMDSIFRDRMNFFGYDCVGLDWDAHHYAMKESLELYPEYKQYIGIDIFLKKYFVNKEHLFKIL